MKKAKFRKSKYDKIVRVLKIIKAKSDGFYLLPNDFSKKFGVSLRTIQRDFKIIREIMGDNFFEKDFNIKNRALKMLAFGFVKLFGNNVLGLDFDGDKKSSLKIITIAPKYVGRLKFSYMNKISEAFELSRYVKIKYKSPSKDESYDVEVIPIGVVYFEGYLYFVAKKPDDNDNLRTFRFDRIVSLEIMDKNVILSKSDINSILQNCRYSIWSVRTDKPNINIELETYEWAKDFFENFEVLADQRIHYFKNGLKVSGKVSNLNEIIPYILRFIPNVKVLKPKKLKDIIKDTVKRYLELYE